MTVTKILFALMITNLALAAEQSTVLDNSRTLESAEVQGFESLDTLEITNELLDKLENTTSLVFDDQGNVSYNPILKIGHPVEKDEKPSVSIEEMNAKIEEMFSKANHEISNRQEGLSVSSSEPANLWANGCYLYDTPCGCNWWSSCCILGSYRVMIYKLERWINYFRGLPCNFKRNMIRNAMIARNTFNCSPVIFQLMMNFIDRYVLLRCYY